eukprot:symbB.v1.2.033079.t1/scaffold4061.1/size45390/2
MEKLETSEVAVAPTSQLALTAPTSEYPGLAEDFPGTLMPIAHAAPVKVLPPPPLVDEMEEFDKLLLQIEAHDNGGSILARSQQLNTSLCCLSAMHVIGPGRSGHWVVLACLVIGARGQVLGKYPGVQYEALRDDHCFDPTGKAKSTLYCNKDAGDHGREVCDKAGGKYDNKISANKKSCIDRCTEEGDGCVGIRWQAVAQHCTILYGVCDDSNDGKNFRSEYWRKLQPSDFEIPNVGLSTCNGTMLQCSNDGTDPCEAQEDCMKVYHGCGDGFVQCRLDAPWQLASSCTNFRSRI